MIKKYSYINVEREFYDLKDKDIIIWGRCESALKLYVEIKSANAHVIGFVDSYVTEDSSTYAGIRLYSVDEIKDREGLLIYIAATEWINRVEILEMLEEFKSPTILMKGIVYGPGRYDTDSMCRLIEKDRIIIDFVKSCLEDEISVSTYTNLLEYRQNNDWHLIRDIMIKDHKQYFPPDIISFDDNEVFVDAGGYNGETSVEFSKYVHGLYDKVFILEPDCTMCAVAHEIVSMHKLHDVEIIGKGAFSNSGTVKFHNNPISGSSTICDKGEVMIQTVSIDDLLEEKRASFIKMDIEGAEMEALEGAEKTIINYRPKLAISVYHKPDDLWKIPFYLMNKYPKYRYYMRHYTITPNETVLYATPK